MLLDCGRPGVVVAADALRVGAIQDQRRDPFGVRGREKHAHRPALGYAEQRRFFRACGIHYRSHVVHTLLERGELLDRDPVREAGAALVEQDQPTKGREPTEKQREVRVFPRVLDVRHKARDVDKIERSVSYDLVGNAVVTALRVARRRSHSAHSAGIIRTRPEGQSRLEPEVAPLGGRFSNSVPSTHPPRDRNY